MTTRRSFIQKASAISAVIAFGRNRSLSLAQSEGGVYHNPILGGDHPDASPIRVDDEFFLTYSSFDYAPGLIILHSRDLLNWRPVAAALRQYYGSVYAPYLCEYEGRFFIYFPADHRIKVVHADHPAGPWSDPIDLGIPTIDPAHIAENGRRFLYLAAGQMAELTSDGLAVKLPPRTVIEPWSVPASWRIECTCLEAPKVFWHDGYFYLTLAEGGTAGPATSHAVVSARSRHADGPWEYSPFNPIAHTQSRADRWMSVGHGRLVDTPDGKWYMTVHAYEDGYRTLGRQMLLLPVEWTPKGWFRVPPKITAESRISVPIPGTTQHPSTDPSDDFASPELGLQWGFWHDYDPARFTTGNGVLTLQPRGTSLADTSALTTTAGGHSYTVEADVEITPECEAGLLLFYDPLHATGIVMNSRGISVRSPLNSFSPPEDWGVSRATLRIVNGRQEVDFYFLVPGKPWRRIQASAEISGMDHNVLGGFLSVRPAIYACGSGEARFRNFRYWPEAKAPM